jgi:hypothetical protein
VGLILFALLGLFPGSLIGGIIGLKIAGGLFGMPVQATVIARLIVAACMIVGVLTAAITFIFGTGITGWIVGTIYDAVKSRYEAETIAQGVSH